MADIKTDTVAITELIVFESIITQATQSKTKAPEYAKCLRQFIQFHSLGDCDNVRIFFNTSWKRFNRLKKLKASHAVILDQASTIPTEFPRAGISPTSSPEPPVKTKRKSFTDLGTRMRKERTGDLLQYINDYVQKECPELSTTQMLGYLVHRINIQSQKDIARVGHQLFTESVSSSESFLLDEAIAMMHSLTLSREQMRKMRHLLLAKGIYFPTSNELLEGRAKLRPIITPILDGKGVKVEYKELVKMTVESTLKVALAGKCVDNSGEYEMVFKDGGDGAGAQIIWNSTATADFGENMFQYGLTPLKLLFYKDGEAEVLWMNYAPNSSKSLRPVFLVREVETNEDLLDLVILTTDQARSELAAEGICTQYQSDTGGCQAINVKIVIHDTMKDLKFKRHISGLGGADCILCISKQGDWTDREKVNQGFPIKRTAEDTMKLYQGLVNSDGEVKCHSFLLHASFSIHNKFVYITR